MGPTIPLPPPGTDTSTGRAENMPFFRRMVIREWPDLLTAAGFALIALGYLSGVRAARLIGEQLRWWWPFEILGSFFLMTYLAFWESLAGVLASPRKRFDLLAVLFGALTLFLWGALHIPLTALAVSALVLLPGYIPTLVFSDDANRYRFLRRGGLSFCTFGFSLLPMLILIGLLEPRGVQALGRTVYEGTMFLFWGTFFFILKAAFLSINYRGPSRFGVTQDPR